jgi:DNA helicase-2/ATP-dependent DNA helicase PcrA
MLTREQLYAVGSPAQRLFLEAAPGSGKTTVAAHRFALQRYGSGYRLDPHGVIAVSFTRAATWELRTRVQRSWGHGAVRLPHRIETLDTLMCDLVHALLAKGLIAWPGQHVKLDVADTWRSLTDAAYSDRVTTVRLNAGQVQMIVTRAETRASRPVARQVQRKFYEGVCTHDEIRAVLQLSLQQPVLRDALAGHLSANARALIVDEVFDANELDLDVVELACSAGLHVTLIGDPWQALYRFRGARPDLVPDVVERGAMLTLPLSESFRWRSEEQAELARRLRAGDPVVVPSKRDAEEPDVVLASEWAHLWSLEPNILPLAFGSAKGNVAEAGATLLLDYVTRSLLGLDAVYTTDALATLRITDPVAVDRLDASWPRVIDALRQDGTPGLKAGYAALVDLLTGETDTAFPQVRANYTKRLGWLRERLAFSGDVVAGMTVHQAKGREWNLVGVALQDSHIEHLQRGLSSAESLHRQLYVACTRARDRTVAIDNFGPGQVG